MSLQTRLNAFIAAVGADIKDLRIDRGSLAFFRKTFLGINPTNIAGTFRNHPDGMQTYVLPYTGKYVLTVTDVVTHSGVYNYENTTWGIGGTATRLDGLSSFDSWMASGGVDGNRSEVHVGTFQGTAGQTITFYPSCRVGAAAGANTNHIFTWEAQIELVGK